MLNKCSENAFFKYFLMLHYILILVLNNSCNVCAKHVLEHAKAIHRD